MIFRHGTIAALGLILALPPAWAGAAGAPSTRPAPEEAHRNSPVDELVPELDTKGARLGDFVNRLADQWKDMQIVQFNGHWQELALPNVHLRNVTRKQVLMLLSSVCPELSIHPLDQQTGGGLFGNRGEHVGNVWIFEQLKDSAIPEGIRVSAFGLAQTVDRLAFHRMAISADSSHRVNSPDKDSEQKALKDVLSLIQATLDQCTEPAITPTVMLHEPTETVLVKGTPAQINAVTQAIQALNTSVGEKSLESKLLQATSENSLLRQQLTLSLEREAKLKAAAKAATEGKPGSKK